MSRIKRKVRNKYIVFCEGDTEYNYINGMRQIQNDKNNIAIKPVPLEKGGYRSFLTTIKESANSNCIAKFIMVDFDRAIKHYGEKSCLIELINYCINENKKKKIPHFIILSNPNFDYLSCLHSPLYNEGDISSFITGKKGFGFKSMEEYKGKKDIFIFLNSNGNDLNIMRNKLRNRETIVKNTYTLNKQNYEVKITDTKVCLDNEPIRGANINELFDILDW